ncbi:MAG: L-2-amino-thiazoline-4-carboxylic acid hydrolase [Proteobacteria bacterium]|nr:L-2-amino-thiazoline-4-carboxylic acid hydrolase [Pseudomonadota bacterium]
MSKLRYPRMAAAAGEMQKREYPGNWVQEFIVGDGEAFDLGFDYSECGIVKFMDAQNAPELAPHLCQTDFAALEAMGLHLERTETIASGCERCNFRISKR